MKKIYIHQSSYVDQGAKVGEGTKIWHFCHIQSGAEIGNNCSFGQNVSIGPNVKIGNNVKVQNNVSVYEGVTIEDDVFVGPSVVFTNVVNPRSFINRTDEFKETIIERGASIGANSTIVCGNSIGKYSFIGAGSVVTKEVLDYAMVYGVPSKREGWVCECGNRLSRMIKRKWFCDRCDKRYKYDWHNLIDLGER